MTDVFHWIGADLRVGARGDLLAAEATDAANQRIVRRLLTNPGAYVWHPEYGAGLGRLVGTSASSEQVRALIRQHVLLEPAVSQQPPPDITVQQIRDGMSVRIVYTEAPTGEQRTVGFDITG